MLQKFHKQKYVQKNIVPASFTRWTPPNVSVPLLNLVDTIFQLNRRGWLRRQMFWMTKQNVVAQGFRYLQDVLWPEGTFFLELRANQANSSLSNEGTDKTSSGSKNTKQGSFEEQL
ncbi:phox-associated domain-containing protein [Tanacetum coccineum]